MQECIAEQVLDLLAGKWKMRIIWFLFQQESIRFNELKKKIDGISNIMLAKCLKEFEENGIVWRIQYNEIPPRVEYSLTEEGKKLGPIIVSFIQWKKEMDKDLEGKK